ncbi:MAG: HAD family hydrolase [Chloroflexota bacterium]
MKNTIKAVLFDLDGTLLENDMDVFLPHYLRLLSARLAHIVPPQEFVPHLMRASDRMAINDGRATNEQVFFEAFFPIAGHSRQDIEPIFEAFYAEDFASLRQHTRRKPEARQAVQQAFDLGCRVVIATNPFFPTTAVQQRLEWAGVAGFPFDLVTTYENSRAAKPSLLYFEQILQAIDQPPQATLVVGDEDMDMVAAHLGCATFLVPGPRTQISPDTPAPTWRGTLTDLTALLAGWK